MSLQGIEGSVRLGCDGNGFFVPRVHCRLPSNVVLLLLVFLLVAVVLPRSPVFETLPVNAQLMNS